MFAIFAAHQAANQSYNRGRGIATSLVRTLLRRHARPRRASLLCAVLGCALTGCGLGNGPGSVFVDPGKFDGYHCNDLIARWQQDTQREKELRFRRKSTRLDATSFGTTVRVTIDRAIDAIATPCGSWAWTMSGPTR